MSKSQTANSLDNWEFDNDTESSTFFGIKTEGDEDGTNQVIKEVKGNIIGKGGPESTNLDEEGRSVKTSTLRRSKASKQDDFEDEEEPVEGAEEDDESTWFKDVPSTKPTKKAAATKEEEEEDDELDEEEKSKKKPAAKAKAKGKEEEEEEADEDVEDDPVIVAKKDKLKEDEENEERTEEEEKEFYTTLVKELKDKGTFEHIEVKKGQQFTEEQFFEAQEAEVDARVDEAFQAFFTELKEDKDAIDFLNYKRNGGKTSDFMSVYSAGINIEKFDPENKAHIQKVLTHYLTQYENLEPDDLEDRLAYIRDKGQEKVKAEQFYEKIQAAEAKAKEKFNKDQEAANKKRQEEAQAFAQEFAEVANATESVGVFSVTKSEVKELIPYITKQTVKVGKNKYVPAVNMALSKVLSGKTEEDKRNLLILGKLLKNNFQDITLVEKVETKVTKKAKSKLREAKISSRPSGVGASPGTKSIADFFDEG